MTRIQSCGPGGKMPPDTAGKEERVSKLVAVDVSPLQFHAKSGKSEPTDVGCYDERSRRE